MTWKRIKHPSEMVELGQPLKVMILNIDREKGRVALGLKQKESNPWDEIEQKYPQGTRVTGRITNLLPYGAFMEIEPGIEGLIHVSEMSWVKNIVDPGEVVSRGEEVEAVVLSVQKAEGKISLGLKHSKSSPMKKLWNLQLKEMNSYINAPFSLHKKTRFLYMSSHLQKNIQPIKAPI